MRRGQVIGRGLRCKLSPVFGKKERNPSSERQKNDKNWRRERGGNKYGDATLRVYAFLETGLQKEEKKEKKSHPKNY